MTNSTHNMYGNRFWEYLITNPSLRWFRHFVLILILAVILIRSYVNDYQNFLGFNWATLLNILLLFSMWGAVAINLYILIPKYLFRGSYGKYLLYILLFIIYVGFLITFNEYVLERYYNIEDNIIKWDWSFLVFLFVNLFIIGFYIFAFSFTIYLQRWVFHNQQINMLEKNKLRSHLNQLKDQVQPEFLSRMLKKADELSKINEKEASTLLLDLSHLLKYQLYDSTREEVLLSADISFIKDYLNLENLYNPAIDYRIITNGNINYTLVPPLLFIPIVARALKYINRQPLLKNPVITIRFEVYDKTLCFICAHIKDEEQLIESELNNLYSRLDLLYGKEYILRTASEEGYYYTSLQVKL